MQLYLPSVWVSRADRWLLCTKNASSTASTKKMLPVEKVRAVWARPRHFYRASTYYSSTVDELPIPTFQHNWKQAVTVSSSPQAQAPAEHVQSVLLKKRVVSFLVRRDVISFIHSDGTSCVGE